MNSSVLTNFAQDISRENLLSLIIQANAAARQSFRAPTKISVMLFSQPRKAFSGERKLAEVEAYNNSIRLKKTADVSEITPALWQRAADVAIIIEPSEGGKFESICAIDFNKNEPRQLGLNIAGEYEPGSIIGSIVAANPSLHMRNMWSLGYENKLIAVEKAKQLTIQFSAAAAQAFGALCKTQITLYRAPRRGYPNAQGKTVNEVAAYNAALVLFKTNDVKDLTSALWCDASEVAVLVSPIESDKVRQEAIGTLEFKNSAAKQVGFYVAGERTPGATRAALVQANPCMQLKLA